VAEGTANAVVKNDIMERLTKKKDGRNVAS
jgi:hypothetical protein